MKTGLTIYFLLLLSSVCLAQLKNAKTSLWHLSSISGAATVSGFHREQESVINNYSLFPKSTFYSAGLRLNTQSYFWHPNLLLLDVDVEVNPGTYDIDYLVLPNVSEVRTLNKLDISGTFFNQKMVNLKVYANLFQNNINRENLVGLKSTGNQWGGVFSYRNKFLPLTIRFKDAKWNQREVETGRIFKNKHKNIFAEINKSFTSKDNHKLSYSRDEYFRQDFFSTTTINQSDYVSLKNNIAFDDKKKYVFTSVVSNTDQRGDYPFKRLQTSERISVQLPENFRLTGQYQFYNYQQNAQTLKQHSLIGRLNHKLYSSLKSNLYVEYYKIDRLESLQFNTRAGFKLNYVKKIPKGQLSLFYGFFRYHQNVTGNSVPLQFFNEPYTLADDQIVLLDQAYIDPASIVVKDEAGVIVYQADFDYFIIPRGDFLEIQRVPGGQIENNGTVYIDFVAIQPGSYQFDTDNNSFSANLLLFNRIVEVYYRRTNQNYKNIEFANFLTLNQFSQNIYGGRLKIGFASAGVEFENYESVIIPYLLRRYYLELQGSYRQKLLYSFNANLRDYRLIGDEEDQQYLDISGRIAYRFKPNTKLILDIGYRTQSGREIDLDLLRVKSELTTVVRQLYLTFGAELYNRTYILEALNYKGVYFKIERRF